MRNEEAFEELKKLLNTKELHEINVFDTSFLYDENKVGAMISLKNGAFDKSKYRKFIIKDKDNKGDINYIYECILRQYSRILSEHKKLPSLIIMDGGLEQIKACLRAQNELNINVKVIGLKKDRTHKTSSIIFPNKKEIYLDKETEFYNYLLNIQEEVHRFAITFFRKKKNTIE
jgi:excinuclease ABC subunit C